MSKYCIKCGRELPKGTEICPDCAAELQENDAALFTKMTAETEVWKNTEPVKQKKRRTARSRSSQKTMVLCIAVLLVLAVTGTLLLVFRPAARVTRAIRSGDISRAYEIYWSSASLAGERTKGIDKAVISAADKLCTQFANNEIGADEAASQLSMLGGFGEGAADMLADRYALFRSFNNSHEHMVEGEKLFAEEKYLEAREEFLLVEEIDANYGAAQARITTCLTRYGETVAARAETQMDEDDYPAAIATLKKGNSTLYAMDTFSEAIDSTLLDCYARYEQFLLDRAEDLSRQEEFDAAVELLQNKIGDFPTAPDSLTRMIEACALSARDQHVAEAGQQANALYEEGHFAEAFAVLEEIRDRAPENKESASELITALERRFTDEICEEARTRFGGKREKLPDAIRLLDEALEARKLEPIKACREDLAQYLPLSLVTAEFTAKEGVVFRSDGEFESLDGTKFDQGWIWGENHGYICFNLDAAYDVLTCSFATRRDDNTNANGNFELWCDGEKVYTAEMLYHWQKEFRSITVDVSGCKELKIVFLCDYTVSTAESGYCYHGICDPILTKDMPGVKE